MRSLTIASDLHTLDSAARSAGLSFNNAEIDYGIADFDGSNDCDHVGLVAGIEIGAHFIVGFGGIAFEDEEAFDAQFGGSRTSVRT